jgi:hypothetical protein
MAPASGKTKPALRALFVAGFIEDSIVPVVDIS